MRNLVHRCDRIVQRHLREQRVHIVGNLRRHLQQPQQQACCAEFQCLRHIHAIGVPDNHMQTPVFVRAMRFVARVDDRAVEGGLQSDAHMDVVGALAELEARMLAPLPQPHTPRPRIQLACDQMCGHQRRNLVKGHGTQHHVILMRAPAGTFAVNIIAIQHHRAAGASRRLLSRTVHDQIAGMVVANRFKRVGRLRRGIFGMRVVDVHPATVGRDDIGDMQLGCVREHVEPGGSTLQPVSARVIDRILLPVIPPDTPTGTVIGGGDYIEAQPNRIRARIARPADRIFGFRPHHSANAHSVSLFAVFRLARRITRRARGSHQYRHHSRSHTPPDILPPAGCVRHGRRRCH